ncbi:MAG: hypothetical protein GXP45_05305 [bacterium]|nr:hypothetical protein [bacterium]
MGNYLEYHDLSESVRFAGKIMSLEEVLVATKLLFPTLRRCDSYLRNMRE